MVRTEDLVIAALHKIKRRRRKDIINTVFKVIESNEELHQEYMDILTVAYPSGSRALNQTISCLVKRMTGGCSIVEGNPCFGHTLAQSYTTLSWD